MNTVPALADGLGTCFLLENDALASSKRAVSSRLTDSLN